MSVTALTGPHIQAKGSTRGRRARVDLLGIHSAEGATNEIALGRFFAQHDSGSSNAGIGQQGGYATYVPYGDTPWTNPPVNSRSDTVELCGFARWSRQEWLDHSAMLETLAHWIAWRCAVRGIPIRHLGPGQAGSSGVAGHKDINDTYHKSTHTDPGPNFPWDVVIDGATAIAQAAAQPRGPKHGYHKDYRPGDKYPDIKLVHSRFHLDGTQDVYDTALRRAIRVLKRQRRLPGNPDLIDRATWNEVWR